MTDNYTASLGASVPVSVWITLDEVTALLGHYTSLSMAQAAIDNLEASGLYDGAVTRIEESQNE